MYIEHVAIWARDLEKLKAFYERYFGARAGEKYVNERKAFAAYFLTFDSGARLELMHVPAVTAAEHDGSATPAGYAHIALRVGSEAAVDVLTAQLRADGHPVLDGPRRTGGGYYLSTVADPEGNRMEIMA